MSLAFDDTIAAIATPVGEAGLAVVRVSGPRALAIADAVFRGRGALASAAGHTLHHGWLGAPARVDETVAAVFRAPASYTREDVVEFSCHGGRLPARRALELLLAAGARLARPGEFTLRAFLSGRLDLLQAEAVAELIHARSDAMHRAALSRLAGELSRELAARLDEVTDMVAEVEARVDFAEDVGGIEVPAAVIARMGEVRASLAAHLAGAAWGRAMREGVQVAIAGAPNAGKSSLFNRLVGEDRAIVASGPGTTRDRVSATVEWEGVLFTLSDTAGLRDSDDEIENLGIARARAALAASRVVLWVVDGAAPVFAEAPAAAEDRRVVVALNKCDLAPAAAETVARAVAGAAAVVRVSALGGEGVDALVAAIVRAAGFEPGDVIASERQAHDLACACEALARAEACGRDGAPGEIVALELRAAMAALEELLGVRVGEDVLDRIFSRFCVGK